MNLSRFCSHRCVLVLLSLSGLAGWGCGDSGTSPTEPSNPPVSIQGIWVGTATSLSAFGTCLAEDFRPLTVSARWAIEQNGATFTGRQTLNNVITCPFRGSVNGSAVSFTPESSTPPSFCTVQTVTCSSAPRRALRMELQTDRAILTGTVSGNQMLTSGTAVWRITDVETGVLVGNYEVLSNQALQKQ